MTATNVKSQWSGGDLYFYDKDGNEIAHWDGTNRKLVVPAGSALEVDGVTVDSDTLAMDGVTASAAEINVLDGVTAGTAAASKAAVLGTNKNLDTLVIADGGLKLGAAAGTAVTSTAAELNTLDGVVAGTTTASKALVVGADKNLDTLAIADGGLKLGAAAGTAVTSTAAELNILDGAAASGADGLGFLRVARATFDPSTNAGERTAAAHGLGVTLPDDAIVVGGFVEVNTTFTSGDDSATIALSVEGANDIVAAVAIGDGTPWDAGLHAIVPKANTPESTGIKLTAAREITATVAVQDLTAGKLTIFLYYVVGA